MDVSDKILQCLRDRGQLTTAEILKSVVAPERSIYDHLVKLVRSGQVVKLGRRPYVSYKLSDPQITKSKPSPTTQDPSPTSW